MADVISIELQFPAIHEEVQLAPRQEDVAAQFPAIHEDVAADLGLAVVLER